MKTFIVGTHKKCLDEALLMRTHNVCFCGEVRKIAIWIPSLIRAIGSDYGRYFQHRLDSVAVQAGIISVIHKNMLWPFFGLTLL